jgi:hypothetical protein
MNGHVMSYFGQFMCPTLGDDRSHHQSLKSLVCNPSRLLQSTSWTSLMKEGKLGAEELDLDLKVKAK